MELPSVPFVSLNSLVCSRKIQWNALIVSHWQSELSHSQNQDLRWIYYGAYNSALRRLAVGYGVEGCGFEPAVGLFLLS